ncbi:MAG: dTDP-4-dehydrorhamnose 3,5-epimerase [Proteobacteria bacterium]|jgi:dTDP-4-dehydrorhamnose 3,5-epimerase|nr:dTDP-4-dehydrorhamnose 3,5-epimerase [Pseudomonadota bacterium]
MDIIETDIPGVLRFAPRVFEDERGFFMESFRASWLPDFNFVQDNHSRSVKGTLRGLHFQLKQPQGKLVRAVRGEVFDVAVDIRPGSETYGKWTGCLLSEHNRELFWVPPGFAHGFVVLSDTAEFQYKCTEYYAPGDEYGIRWNDPTLAIEWPITADPVLSERDSQLPFFNEATLPGGPP